MNGKSIDKLRKEFLAAFNEIPNYDQIDSKHLKITRKVHQKENWLDEIDLINLINWEMQGDLGVPTNFSNEVSHHGNPFGIIRYLLKKISRRAEDDAKRKSILDDLEIIKLIGKENLLFENPVRDLPGNQNYININGCILNMRWLRYIYLLGQIQNNNLILEDGIWLDIGSYYGGLQGLVRKYHPTTKIVMVDFEHQLFRSYAYLSQMFPTDKHYLNPVIQEKFSNQGFYYISASKFNQYKDLKPNLSTNFFSFGEMMNQDFRNYWESKAVAQSDKIYTVNRFVSGPFFEKTYDTSTNVNDYTSKHSSKIEYFDVFPIHHFALLKRTLLKGTRLRNASSGYFELVINNI